jgi:hypothetical protein
VVVVCHVESRHPTGVGRREYDLVPNECGRLCTAVDGVRTTIANDDRECSVDEPN